MRIIKFDNYVDNSSLYVAIGNSLCKASRGFTATAELVATLTKESVCGHPDVL